MHRSGSMATCVGLGVAAGIDWMMSRLQAEPCGLCELQEWEGG
jgi:hypothetical protein